MLSREKHYYDFQGTILGSVSEEIHGTCTDGYMNVDGSGTFLMECSINFSWIIRHGEITGRDESSYARSLCNFTSELYFKLLGRGSC